MDQWVFQEDLIGNATITKNKCNPYKWSKFL